MERQRPPRARSPASFEAPRQQPQTQSWSPASVVGGVAAIGVVGVAGLLAYRYFTAPSGSKKSRSRHGKKEKSKKKAMVEEEEAPPVSELRKSTSGRSLNSSRGALGQASKSNPLTMSRAASDATLDAQLEWFVEIAFDQYEARQLKQAKFYAEKALAIGATVPAFHETRSYYFMRFIVCFEKENRDDQLQELQSILEGLNKLPADEMAKREYLMLKGRVLSNLSDQFIKRKMWVEAEPVCAETCAIFEKTFAEQEDNLNSNLGLQKYQLCIVKRNLKKLDEALAAATSSYEYTTKSKLRSEFSSAVARQRADILDALGRYPEAKQTMQDHLERLASQEVAAKPADGEEPSGPPAPSPNNRSDNLLFLARLSFEHSDYDEAIKLLKQAYELVPSPYYLSMLASSQFEAGLNEDALKTQADLKRLRINGEMPITASRLLLTRNFHIRQKKLDGAWTFDIAVENKPETPMGTTHHLKADNIIECYVRVHYDPEEAIPVDAPKPIGPFVYTVKGDEADNVIKIRGILPKVLAATVYEIVLTSYNSKERTERLGTHRQLARAQAYNATAYKFANLGSPFGDEDEEFDDEDYILPESIEEHLIQEHPQQEAHHEEDDDEEVETLNADELHAAESAEAPSPSESTISAPAPSLSSSVLSDVEDQQEKPEEEPAQVEEVAATAETTEAVVAEETVD